MLPQLTPPLLACGLAKMLYYVHFLGRSEGVILKPGLISLHIGVNIQKFALHIKFLSY